MQKLSLHGKVNQTFWAASRSVSQVIPEEELAKTRANGSNHGRMIPETFEILRNGKFSNLLWQYCGPGAGLV